MRASGRLTAGVLAAVAREVRPGVTTRELDLCARDLIAREGGASAFLGFRGFPGHICVSINDEVVHGIPGDRRVEMGDIVSLDCGVLYQGWHGDTARTVRVGTTDPEALRLVRVTEDALAAAVAAAVEGRRLGDVSHAVQSTVEAAGFSVVREFVGHGIGRRLHEEPQIPNFGTAGRGPVLRAGMTLAIEPMVNQRGCEVRVGPDGWTVRTVDGGLSAHAEHTVAVRAGAAEVLTCSDGI
ncbi:MAG: type I methionyl aminopeptidase [Verrucomicrobia bacterium A1]|nr:MAG: type I methionyl aminopeptidase [Verrucomicrobia bacterium A1]